jgi:hypothetical protein
MKRMLIPITVAIVLGLPGTAIAALYAGPFTPEVNNDGVEIGAKLQRGRAIRVTQVEFHNVPTGTPCNGSNIFFGPMRVNDNRRFNGSGHPGRAGNADWPPTPNLTVTIHGHFTRHNKKIVGTLRIRGTGGCTGDTGRLSFVAPRFN